MKKRQTLVEEAQKLSASDLKNFLQTAPNDFRAEIVHGLELPSDYRSEIFDLFQRNMKELYENSNDGYRPDEKKDELFHRSARYILLLNSANDLIGFVHFRFDMDHGVRVIYLYEIQIDVNYRAQGLGHWLIEQMKTIGQRTRMKKLLLTVHKANERALNFYLNRKKFRIDQTDPTDDESVDYRILSLNI